MNKFFTTRRIAAALALVAGVSMAIFATPTFGLPLAVAMGVGTAVSQFAIWDGDDEG